MKQQKFNKIVSERPEVLNIIRNLYLLYPGGDWKREVKAFIRERIEYIAFRPFEQLTMQESYCMSDQVLATRKAVSYVVHFRIGNERILRERSLHSEGEKTLRELFLHLKEWYKECLRLGNFTLRDNALEWAYIVKTTHGCGRSITVEIYDIPADFEIS